jgi:hypothetical protein
MEFPGYSQFMRPIMKTMLSISLATSISLASAAAATTPTHAAPYYRFWRGWKAPTHQSLPLTDERFERELDRTFVPATVDSGADQGLIAYLPALPFTPAKAHGLRARGIDVADEIALVVYQSEAAYLALRETPAGKAYQDLHRDYFEFAQAPAPPRSRSLVPRPLPATGTALELEHAYDVLEADADWQAPKASAVTVLHERKPGMTDEDYLRQVRDSALKLKAAAPQIGLASYVVLVAPASWIEYQLWTPGSKPQASRAADIHRVPLKARKHGDESPTPLRWGGGLNVLFKRG